MNAEGVLRNAPIAEALLDIRTPRADALEIDLLAKFEGLVGKNYPTRRVQVAWEGQIKVLKEGSVPTALERQTVGFWFTSRDGRQIVQARRDGFSFSRLQPYRDWDSFSVEGRDLWGKFVRLTKVKKVERIALRYINRVDLPLPITDLREYIATYPRIADGLPDQNTDFFLRLVITDAESKATGIITEATQPLGPSSEALRLILDIDVSRASAFPSNPSRLWPHFEPLRTFKNRIFFRTMTERALDLYR